jgi:hypothetical protein
MVSRPLLAVLAGAVLLFAMWTVALKPHATPHPATVAAPATKPAPSHAPAPKTPTERQNAVERALNAHKVLALLFYNPAAADDSAVRHELASVPSHDGRVVTLAVPLSELTRYRAVTNQVPIGGSPALVVIDRAGHASSVVGFADSFEISQRVAAALAH